MIKMSKKSDSELVSNRKAFHNYEILETLEAGIMLLGSEVKSLRNHGGSLQDAYVIIGENGDVLLKNASIAPYTHGHGIFGHEERRDRKLLLHKREIARLRTTFQEKGLALVPLAMYLKQGIVKVKIASARGKKAYDKRQSLKEKEHKKSIDRAMKERR